MNWFYKKILTKLQFISADCVREGNRGERADEDDGSASLDALGEMSWRCKHLLVINSGCITLICDFFCQCFVSFVGTSTAHWRRPSPSSSWSHCFLCLSRFVAVTSEQEHPTWSFTQLHPKDDTGAVLQSSNPLLTFIFLFLYASALIAFLFIISTFFNRSTELSSKLCWWYW